MNQMSPWGETVTQGTLFERVDHIIEQGQQVAAIQTNAAQTMTFWRIGAEIHIAVLAEERADYGQQIVYPPCRRNWSPSAVAAMSNEICAA